LFTDYHSVLTRCRNHFCQLSTVHGVNDVWQTDTHTAEPLGPEPRACEVELAIEKLKRHKSPVLIKSQQNCLRQGVEHFAVGSIYLVILFGIKKKRLRSVKSRSLYSSIRRVIKRTVGIIGAYHFFQLRTKLY
jgi:hypothetical protein